MRSAICAQVQESKKEAIHRAVKKSFLPLFCTFSARPEKSNFYRFFCDFAEKKGWAFLLQKCFLPLFLQFLGAKRREKPSGPFFGAKRRKNLDPFLSARSAEKNCWLLLDFLKYLTFSFLRLWVITFFSSFFLWSWSKSFFLQPWALYIVAQCRVVVKAGGRVVPGAESTARCSGMLV